MNVMALMNLGDFLAPSIWLVEHAGVVCEHEDFVGRFGEFDRRGIDVTGLTGLQLHLQIVVS